MPKPVYRAEWAKQGLTGKGVVLVAIDKQTGMVTGARMLTSTGNQQLDGAALQAYNLRLELLHQCYGAGWWEQRDA